MDYFWDWFDMSGILQGVLASIQAAAAAPGQQAYTTAGTYSWVAPAGVTSVSVVCVGGGGHGAVRPVHDRQRVAHAMA